MHRLLLAGALLLAAACARATDIKYPVSAIPEKLLKGANVVKRMEEYEVTVNSLDEMIVRHKYALTIMNENGDDYAPLVEYYDKLNQVRSIEGSLYDSHGVLLKKLKNKDVLDISAVDDNSLMDDNRRKVHQFYDKDYPYTVEYEVEERVNNTLFFPHWQPVPDDHYAVEQSAYTIVAAPGQVRFQAFNYTGAPVESTVKDKKALRWEVKELPPVKIYFASPSWRELTTMVYFAPSDFAIQGYKGNMSNWQEFGKFVYSLKKDRDQLPANVQQKVQQLTAGITDTKEKIRVLYEYLQHQTRYISIQLGLGGWQPFEAGYVAQKGYGDCKALTNYMYSLLKAANIRSCYTLVRADEGPSILENFPSQQFNHVILCVPMGKDTTWLECTSQDLPAGYMSEFTGNRKALIIDEAGGTLVSTPRYGIHQNVQVRNIKAKIDGEGNLAMESHTRYGGTQQDGLSALINNLSKEKVKKVLQQNLELSTYDVSDFKYEETRSAMPELKEELDINVSAYATLSGRRIFITPNILNRSGLKLDEEEGRTVDFVFKSEWRDEDDYEIEIPEGYEVESAPAEVSIKTEFGTYASSTRLVGNKIYYHRVREQFSGRFPARDGARLAKFFADIYKADRSRLVCTKKQ